MNLKPLAALGCLVLSGCATVAGVDAQFSNFVLGRGYAPQGCVPGPEVPIKIQYGSIGDISRACGAPSFECVRREHNDPLITIWLTNPKQTPEYLQGYAMQHALCHAKLIHENNDFSHKEFQRLPPRDRS